MIDDADYFTEEVAVGALDVEPGKPFKFIYDFGANWRFKVVLEGIDPGREVSAPQVVASKGKAPPEYGDDYDDW